MECEEIGNGPCFIEWSRQTGQGFAVKRKLGGAGGGGVRLDVAAAVRGSAAAGRLRATHAHARLPRAGSPFINDETTREMDEISYWVTTKRAPCLMNYDSIVTKPSNDVESKVEEVSSPKKKKRRKLSILDDESLSSQKQQNVYFETSQQNQRTILSSCKSDSFDSDVDFNIRNTSIQDKSRKLKAKKYNRNTLHKKNKVVTSTPRISNTIRRSLRKNDHANKNISFNKPPSVKPNKIVLKLKEEVGDSEPHVKVNGCNQIVNTVGTCTPQMNLNGQFEDLSDVSGFTANYIRSTKIKSTKTPRNLRKNCNRLLVDETRQTCPNTIVCPNKNINTCKNITTCNGAGVLNCSTDSSQNVVNFMTEQDNKKMQNINKSTSLLKFLDPKPKTKERQTKKSSTSKVDLNISFTSMSSSNSRYPKRNKTQLSDPSTSCLQLKASTPTVTPSTNMNSLSLSKSIKTRNDLLQTSRTRSGKCIRQKHNDPEELVQVFSTTTLPVSSNVTMNVADARNKPEQGKKTLHRICLSSGKKRLGNCRQSVKRESQRNKSGFTACFSDSDDEGLKQRKFFDA